MDRDGDGLFAGASEIIATGASPPGGVNVDVISDGTVHGLNSDEVFRAAP